MRKTDLETLEHLENETIYFVGHGHWNMHVGMVDKIQYGVHDDRPALKVFLIDENQQHPIYLYIFNHEGTLCFQFRGLGPNKTGSNFY